MLQKPAPILTSIFITAIMVLGTTPSHAVSLPAIKAASKNTVPGCATPGRLMKYLKSNNPSIRSKFGEIAVHYMRHGERLGLRWDYAFFQMLVETGFLRFNGDVKWTQNNFAGLGATGGGVRGEKFSSVDDGVKAHLEHLLMYTGTHIDSPTADRTRKIQEWKLLAKWQKKFKSRSMTFKDMAGKWAPGSRGYPRDIEFVGEQFYSDYCRGADPNPELVAAARGTKSGSKQASKSASTTKVAQSTTKPSYNLGASKLTTGSSKRANTVTTASTTKKTDNKKVAMLSDTDTSSKTAAKPSKADKTATCRVWSASYGGTHAALIKAVDKNVVNYTVLKVNDGRVQPEAKAYIHAYAKGGTLVKTFNNPDKALERAFELCPEG